MEQWMYWVGALVISGSSFYVGLKRDNTKKTSEDTASNTTMSLNIQYIKDSVDKITLEQKETNRKLEKQSEEIVEMKVAQATMQQEIKVLNKAVFNNDKGV